MYICSTTTPISTSNSTISGTTTTTTSNTSNMYQILFSTGSGYPTCYSPATSHGLGVLIGIHYILDAPCFSSGSTHAIWKDHLRKDRSRRHDKGFTTWPCFPFFVLVSFRKGCLLDWVDYVTFWGNGSFRKAAMEFEMWDWRTFAVFSLEPEKPRCLFATRRTKEPKHQQQQQHEYTMGGHTCRNIADLACF